MSVVAVVGRPNVGKSSLVNRLSGRRDAVTDSFAGVTRDRKVVPADWSGVHFDLVDTGGWSSAGKPASKEGVAAGKPASKDALQVGGSGSSLDAKVSEQAARAADASDLVLLVVDATVGITQEDEAAAHMLRRKNVPVLVVANKVDSQAQEPDGWEAARLGFNSVHLVSALHGRGSGDLLDAIVALLPPAPGLEAEAPGIPTGDGSAPTFREERVAIVGRPNVGKSTLFNRMVGEARSIVHDEPGTTRDSIDTVVETADGAIRFVDTAGLRRKSRQTSGAEYYSLVRALSAIDEADVSLLVIDASEGVTHQDQRLAERIDAAGSPVVMVLNKWEMLDAERRAEVSGEISDRLSFLAYAPVIKVSALTGLGVHKLLPALGLAVEAYRRRVPTAEVNRVVADAQAAQPAPHGARILYATQGAVNPPTFTLFANRALPPPYVRYIERTIREKFGFGPTPLKLRVRRR